MPFDCERLIGTLPPSASDFECEPRPCLVIERKKEKQAFPVEGRGVLNTCPVFDERNRHFRLATYSLPAATNLPVRHPECTL